MRVLICPILLASLIAGMPGRADAEAGPPADAFTSLPVVAQAWEIDQERQPPARIRARSLIKLGLFVAGLIGGLIAFVVRIASQSKRNLEDQFEPTGSGEVRSRQPSLSQTTSRGHESRAQDVAAAASPAAHSWMGWGVAAVALLSLLVVVGGVCVVLLYVGLTAATRNAGLKAAPVQPQQPEFELAVPIADVAPEPNEFDQRWNVAADVVGNDLDQPGDIEESTGTNDGSSKSPDPDPGLMARPVTWQHADVVDSGISISHRGMSFTDLAPAGALLVGLRVTGDGRCLSSIQPIYRHGPEHIDGAIHGAKSNAQAMEFLARPGEAVSAVRLDLSGEVFGIQVEYGKVVAGRIAMTGRYVSPFFGRPVAGSAFVIEGDGDIFVGISGQIRDGFDGLYLKKVMTFGVSPDDQPVAWQHTRMLAPAGRNRGTEFEDLAPDGGVLVGMRFFLGRSWGGAIRAVQPVYRVGSDYKLGKRHGPDGGIVRQAVARPGYAVGRIDARVGLVLNSAKLIFQRVTDAGLDSNESYESPQFGSAGGGPSPVDSSGRFIVGVSGAFRDDIRSIGIIVAD